ncbi:MAG: hypothetical protein QM612_00760 [Thermomonas sp.]|uniref:hypothetical protein n=1 Tax=Thermomonas sp. TaxID=1971895 RepID=UPI0039E4897E
MPTAPRWFWLPSLLVALLAGLLFTPGLPGEFVFDDIPNIVNNDSIQLDKLTAEGLAKAIATPQASGQMRGLPTLTFALDYWRGGGADPATFKTTNILIHALTAFALAWLFRSLLLLTGTTEQRTRWLAPALALAWAAHPLMVSSVLYAVQRLQTLGTLFLVLALLSYLHARQAQRQGRPGRTGLLVALLLWVVAMSCKEDSVQFPAFTLALELTVLRFAAADPRVANSLRRSYLIATLMGALAYFLLVIPQHWHWEAYPGRDFSTPERLLTQARVLCMYLWQIVLPLPSHMPFYYDWLQPSRGLLQPWTTLPAIVFLLALLGIAWRLRTRWPLFSLGVFLFFGAHFVTSNVIGLELAFEHRNHFALIGAVLAVGSLLAHVAQRLGVRPAVQAAICSVLLLMLGATTVLRAQSWSSNMALARASAAAAPHSARAWIQLCAGYFRAGGGPDKTNTGLDQAIPACSSGATLAPYSLNNAALLVVLKTLKGSITPEDWNLLQTRLETVGMSWDNQRSLKILTHHLHLGVKLDKPQVLKALATLSRRTPPEPINLVEIGYFIMNNMGEPDAAMPYFTKAINASTPDDPFANSLAAELREKNRPDLAVQIERLAWARQNTTVPAGNGHK